MNERQKEIVKEDLQIVRERLHDLRQKASDDYDLLRSKVSPYIAAAKGIPSIESTSILYGALTSLAKSITDIENTLLKSYEKEIDVINKTEMDDDGNTMILNVENLMKIINDKNKTTTKEV